MIRVVCVHGVVEEELVDPLGILLGVVDDAIRIVEEEIGEVDERGVELLGENAHRDVLQVEELVVERRVEQLGRQVDAEQVGRTVAVGRIEVVRVVLLGHGPLGLEAHGLAHIVDVAVEGVVGLVGQPAVVQVVVHLARVHDDVVVDFEHEARIRAVLGRPLHGEQRLERQVDVGVDEVLLHDVAVSLALAHHRLVDRLVGGQAEHEHDLDLVEVERIGPRVAHRLARVKVARIARHRDDQRRPLSVASANRPARIDDVCEIVRIDMLRVAPLRHAHRQLQVAEQVEEHKRDH